jgi:hypothetical protein
MSFTNPTSMVELQLLNLITESMLRCVHDVVTTIKPVHLTTGNVHLICSDDSSFTQFPTSGRVYIWRTSKEACNLECLVLTVKHRGGSVMVWAAILWYSIGPIITLHGQIIARDHVDTMGNQVYHMIQKKDGPAPY